MGHILAQDHPVQSTLLKSLAFGALSHTAEPDPNGPGNRQLSGVCTLCTESVSQSNKAWNRPLKRASGRDRGEHTGVRGPPLTTAAVMQLGLCHVGGSAAQQVSGRSCVTGNRSENSKGSVCQSRVL